MATLTPRDEDVLKELYRYSCLTVDQLMRLFDWHVKTDVYKRMRKLVVLRAVDKKTLYAQGNPAAHVMFKLGPVGEQYIREVLGVEPPRFEMGRGQVLPAVWWHTKSINDFFITAHVWEKTQEHITIERFYNDLDLHRDKTHFPALGVIPDGWLFLDDTKQRRRHYFLLEVETGSRMPSAVQKKIQKLVSFTEQKYGSWQLLVIVRLHTGPVAARGRASLCHTSFF
jgi:Replication-relaxation